MAAVSRPVGRTFALDDGTMCTAKGISTLMLMKPVKKTRRLPVREILLVH